MKVALAWKLFRVCSYRLFLLSFGGCIRGELRWFTLGLFVLTALQHMTNQSFSGFLLTFHTVDALFLLGIAFNETFLALATSSQEQPGLPREGIIRE
ncbi:hypothetical protein [Paenibacillus prosopidis]|uniref:hypothetical protein n=1 Tax=Paenibacillus prosopidis TaxID=630520 RepID=UPI0011C027CE|nr:hypothetical protein [Paenibacillus prosopidis]